MESLTESVIGNINHRNLEHSHELLRGYTNIFASNIYQSLSGMIQKKKDIVVVKRDKDSNKSVYPKCRFAFVIN